jgi:hypothetical protein
METIKRIHIYIVFALTMFLLLGTVAAQAATDPALLPEDPLMDDTFRPGFGQPVGIILAVEGEAVLMHADMRRGYRAIGELPLYKGDVLVTMSKARLRLKLNDESIITMVSRTRLTVNDSVFDRAKKRFVSFLKMSIGRARFYVRKVHNMKHPEYRLKTPTAVVGIRGSDFIGDVTGTGATFTAFEETELEVANINFPERIVVVKDHYRTLVKEGRLPTDPILVPLDEIEDMKREFVLSVEDEKGEGIIVSEGTLVPDELLVVPSDPGPDGFEEAVEPDAGRHERLGQLEDDFTEQQSEIEEALAEGPTIPPLPGFPGTP